MEPSGFNLGVMLEFAVVFLILALVLMHDNRSGPRDPDQVHRNAAKMISTFRQQGLMKRPHLLDELD